MKERFIPTYGLRVTNSNYLNEERVRELMTMPLDLMERLVLVQDGPELYLLRGHHEAFVQGERKMQAPAIILEADEDVLKFSHPRIRDCKTLSELLESLRAGNSGSREIGIEIVLDYRVVQPKLAKPSSVFYLR